MATLLRLARQTFAWHMTSLVLPLYPAPRAKNLNMPTAPTITRDPALEAHVFWFKYRREILMAIVLAVAVLLGYGGYWFYSARQDAAAAALLATAHNMTAYQQVIDQYENTNAGASAYLLLGDAQSKEGKYAESNATLQKFIDKHPKHDLAAGARMAIAANLQSQGKIDEALAAYQRVSAEYPKSFEAPLALISQVNILKGKSQNDAARRICESILTQYRDSIWASEAMRQLQMLKPATPPESSVGIPGSPSLGGQKSTPPPMLARPPSAPAPVAPAPSGAAPGAKPPKGKP
jgi:TolA-binding protein